MLLTAAWMLDVDATSSVRRVTLGRVIDVTSGYVRCCGEDVEVLFLERLDWGGAYASCAVACGEDRF